MVDYRDMAAQYAMEYGLDPNIFVAQINQESRFNPNAVSPAGAVGLAQVMPATAAQPGYGVTPLGDRTDPNESLRFGAEYMSALLRVYDGDYRLALAAYNAGAGAVQDAGGRVPNIPETTNYVATILGETAYPGPAGQSSDPPPPPGGQMRPQARPDDLQTEPPSQMAKMRAVYDAIQSTQDKTCPPGYIYDGASGTCVVVNIPQMSPPERPENRLSSYGRGIAALGG